MKSYIYVLLNPTDEKFVYVGKSRYPKTRFFQHLECDGCNPCKDKWISSILAKNQFPILYIIEETTAKQEDQREGYWIEKMQKLGYRLLNLARVEAYKHVSLKEIPGDNLAPAKYRKLGLREKKKRLAAKIAAEGRYDPFTDKETLEILASCRARHEKKLQEQAEKQRLYELRYKNRRNFMIAFCLVIILGTLWYLYPIAVELYKLLRR